MKIILLGVVGVEGMETMYWIIPGTTMPLVVKWKKILQSCFDSVQVVNVALPIVCLEQQVIAAGTGWLWSWWSIAWSALTAHSDKVVPCWHSRFKGADDDVASGTRMPANGSQEWSLVTFSMMSLDFLMMGMSWCCMSSNFKLVVVGHCFAWQVTRPICKFLFEVFGSEMTLAIIRAFSIVCQSTIWTQLDSQLTLILPQLNKYINT